ncbi:unnamed protein product [Closterium sp. NIES-53]
MKAYLGQRESSNGLGILGHGDCGRVFTARQSQRFVDIETRVRRELLRETSVVRRLPGMEEQVLEQQHLAVCEVHDGIGNNLADAVVGLLHLRM